MKLWIPMLILFLAVSGLCIWDSIHTTQVFNHLDNESNEIYTLLQENEITNEHLTNKIWSLNEYWTKKMDILSISISRKDLQPVSDYLQYLCSATINESQEDAITYSRLLNYNILGLKESNGLQVLNLL